MYTMSRTVRCSQIGEDNFIRLGALLDILQDCAYDHLQNEPVLTPYFKQTGNVMFLVSRQVEIFKLPEYNDELTVSTWCYELKRMYGYRNTVIKDKDGNTLVREYETGAFAELETQRPVKISEELADAVIKEEKLDMDYKPRKVALPEREADSVLNAPVHESYIDMYKHVNNARYIDMIADLLPQGQKVKGLRIEYKHPLKKGKDALISVWNENKTPVYAVKNADNELCCAIEVSFE